MPSGGLSEGKILYHESMTRAVFVSNKAPVIKQGRVRPLATYCFSSYVDMATFRWERAVWGRT